MTIHWTGVNVSLMSCASCDSRLCGLHKEGDETDAAPEVHTDEED